MAESKDATSVSYHAGFNSPAASLAALSVFGTIFALILVSNRIYWRLKKLGKVWYDDWCIIIALAFLIAQSAAVLAACDAGYGVQSEQLSEHSIQSALYYFFQIQIYYKITINLTKASIILLYYRIFTTRSFRIICLVLLTIVFIFGVTFTATTIFQCQPIEKIYIASIDGKCLPHLTLWRINALYNILSDIIIILMPFPVLRSLKLPTGQFVGLALILCCGIFVILTAILRFTTLGSAGHSGDRTAGTLKSTIWTQAEACVAVICACLPMMRVMLQRCVPFLRNMSSRSGRSRYRPEDGYQQHHHGYQASELQNYEHLPDINISRPYQPAPYPTVPRLPSQRFSVQTLPFIVIEGPKEEPINIQHQPPMSNVVMYGHAR